MNTEEDLINAIESLYPYYGFRGSESLMFDRKAEFGGDRAYYFREYINGIRTDQELRITVAPSSRVGSIFGDLVIDLGFEYSHMFTKEEAIAAVVAHLRNTGRSMPTDHSRYDAVLHYRTLGAPASNSPWWEVMIDGESSYLVDPAGMVRSVEVIIP